MCVCIFSFHLCTQNTMALKVGLGNRLPELNTVKNLDFKETYLGLRTYTSGIKQKSRLKFNAALLINPCDSTELVTVNGTKEASDYLMTLSDFSCDSRYRISFYVRIKNQPATKVSGLEALRSRNVIADDSGNEIIEFTQVPVAVKPLWKNRSKY